MPATYTFDVFSSVDGFGSAGGDWGGYWDKQGPELLGRRLQLYTPACRMVYGANTFRLFERFWNEIADNPEVEDPWGIAMHEQPATVISTTLSEPLDWPDAVLEREDAPSVVARPGGLHPGHRVPGAHRPQRRFAGVRRGGRLRPGARRLPAAGWQHPGTHLPPDPARLAAPGG